MSYPCFTPLLKSTYQFSTFDLFLKTKNDIWPDVLIYLKQNGKKIYFQREELDHWLLRNRMDSQDEIEQQAADFLIKKGAVKL